VNQLALQAIDLGFSVAPRLNAAGRLDDMSHGIECLLTDFTRALAQQFAEELDSMNVERRSIEGAMQEEALQLICPIRVDCRKFTACHCAV
jgi:single-stranded-DNA-specific exonuclease